MVDKDWCSWSPDSWFGRSISVACKKHDYAYWELYKKPKTPKNVAKRKEVDLLFKERVYELSGSKIIAWLYYVFVRIFGRINLWSR